jgi:RNA polymerase sigma-70 factor (ECF subfamily)
MTAPEADRPFLPEAAADPGSPDAAEQALATRYWERIRLFAARRLGSVSAAEDVAQETLRRVTEALRAGKVRQHEALPGFVFQTALHICLQHHRSTDREARALTRVSGSDESPATDALAALISEERRAAVHRCLRSLRGEDRDLLRQLYFENHEPEAVARRLGVTPGALRVRKHRALQRLAELLGGMDA